MWMHIFGEKRLQHVGCRICAHFGPWEGGFVLAHPHHLLQYVPSVPTDVGPIACMDLPFRFQHAMKIPFRAIDFIAILLGV